MTETLLFLKEFFQNKNSIGGIRPSSKFLAKEIASCINHFPGPKKVLEIGAGTGIISEEILKNLGRDDFFTIVEINPQFAKLLRSKMQEWRQRENCPKIEILNIDFLNLEVSEQFDIVIAGVPFNNFPLEIIEDFIKKIKSISKPKAYFAFFEYLAAKELKVLFFNNEKISNFFKQEVYPHLVEQKKIFLNVPPAKINFISFTYGEGLK